MPHPPRGEARTGALPLLLVAALSALVVAGVYEVRASLARHHVEPRPAQGPSDWSPTDDPPRLAGDRCAELRRTYLNACPQDSVAAPASAPSRAPVQPSSDDDVRSNAELDAWRNPSPDELREMAKRCEVRFEIPAVTEDRLPSITDDDAAALALSSRERDLVERTLADMHAGLRDFAEKTMAETGAADKTRSFEDLLTDLQTLPAGEFDEARERLAQERAGRTEPPASGGKRSPGERLLRLWSHLGNDFERRLAAELGSERAHQLRSSPRAAWMNRFSQSGCRSSIASGPPPSGSFENPSP